MIGAFIQLNDTRPKARTKPVGYVICESGCWEWVAALTDGYGCFWDPVTKKRVKAHRWVYERDRGPIGEGLELDHMCRNHRCVNPWHLEAVTHIENISRGISPPANNARKTHCPKGHPLGGDNVYPAEHGQAKRRCRACNNEYSARPEVIQRWKENRRKRLASRQQNMIR